MSTQPLAQEYLDRALFAKAFLTTIFPHDAQGFIEFRVKCPRGYINQDWHPRGDLPRLGAFLRNNDDCNVWFGVATRQKKGSGGADNCLASWCVYVDADCKTAERTATFFTALRVFPYPPTIIVSTGSPHSFHVYWRLASPIQFLNSTGVADVNNASLYTRTVAGLIEHFGPFDQVSDLPRVMRLPGSRNVKPGIGGAPVRMTWLKPEHVYQIEDFAPYAVVEVPKPPARPTLATNHTDDVDLLDEFTSRGWLIEDQGDAFYYVACPWKHEHSGFSGASETALWQYGNLWCFKCQHSHCAKRRVAECYEYFRLMQTVEVPR